MRFIVVFSMLLMVMAQAGIADEGSVPPTLDRGVIVAEVQQAFEGLVEASKTLDVDRYLEFFDEELFTGLSDDGTVIDGFADLAVKYREMIHEVQEFRSLEFQNVKISVINETTAILVNEYEASVLLRSGDVVQAAGGGIQVWSWIDDQWKLVSVSASARSPAPEL